MDKEFLEDYAAKEVAEWEKFTKRLLEGKINKYENYPSLKRFPKIQKPIAFNLAIEPPWALIPQFGTTLIRLSPTDNKQKFRYIHGFDIDDLSRMIDFSKDTGKIHFVLNSNPIFYKSDFYNDVFKELKPPHYGIIQPNKLIGEAKFIEDFTHFSVLSGEFGFGPVLRNYIDNTFHSDTISNIEKLFTQQLIVHSTTYSYLKYFGYDDLATFIEDLLITHPDLLLPYLHVFNNIIIFPKIQTMDTINCYTLNQLIEAKNYVNNKIQSKSELKLPYEIGLLLSEELKLIIPKNIQGVIELNDKYNEYELQEFIYNINEIIKKQKFEALEKLSLELTTIYKNIWDDAGKIKQKINFLNYAISLSVGIVGNIASMPLQGYVGLLFALGLPVLDKLIESRPLSQVSEKILSSFTDNHLMHIYNFQKRHKII